jgi:hypothetical protein
MIPQIQGLTSVDNIDFHLCGLPPSCKGRRKRCNKQNHCCATQGPGSGEHWMALIAKHRNREDKGTRRAAKASESRKQRKGQAAETPPLQADEISTKPFDTDKEPSNAK